AFRKALSEHGFVEGKSVAFQWRRAGSEYNRFRALADGLFRLHGSAIFSYGGTVGALAAQATPTTIPGVFLREWRARRLRPRCEPEPPGPKPDRPYLSFYRVGGNAAGAVERIGAKGVCDCDARQSDQSGHRF